MPETYACATGGRIVAGRYSLPAWRRAMAPRTWAQVGSNTIADIDPAKNPAMNPNYPSNPEWRGVGGQSGVVYPWCGACFDWDKGQLWLPLGGGHQDYGGNEAYYLDLYSDTPQWRMPRPPSGAIGNLLTTKDGQEASGVYADGQPRAIHSYNKHVYVPGIGILCAYQGLTYFSATGGTRDTWRLDAATGLWTKIATALYVTSSSGSAACYDPGRHCLWWAPQSDGYLQQLDLATMQWATRNDYPRINSFNYKRLIFLADEDLMLLFDKGQAGGFGVFDMTAKTLATPGTTGTMPAGLAGGDIGQGGADWHPDGFVVLWHHATDMARIATLTPSVNKKTDPWALGEIIPANENAITPSVRVTNGTYGRFGYSARLNGYYLQNEVAQKTYFFAAD